MFALVLILCLAQGGRAPGPIDGFKVNLAAIHVDLDFRLSSGEIGTAAVVDGDIWAGRNIRFVEVAAAEIEGSWAFDGRTEWYVCGSPAAIIEAQRGKPQPSVGGYGKRSSTPRVEGLYDGESLAEHVLLADDTENVGNILEVWTKGLAEFVPNGSGPFSWNPRPFPHFIAIEYPAGVPVVHRAQRDGVACEIEVYEREMKSGWTRLEVAYDPARDYLPRSIRQIYSRTGGTTHVRVTCVTKSEACASGGFVPTEWYDALFQVAQYDRSGSGPDRLQPTRASASGRHFEVLRMTDRRAPVALKHLQNIRAISTGGGAVSLPTVPASLTMDEVRGRLGRYLTQQDPRAMPSIDREELNEFRRPPGPRLAWLIAIAILLVAIAGGAWRWRRGAKLLVLLPLLLVPNLGCGSRGRVVVKLTAAFSKPTFLYDGRPLALPMTLIAKNEGNQEIEIRRVDGGCTCRTVDQSGFPARLKPGGVFEIALTYKPDRGSQPIAANFTFETDLGDYVVSTPVHPMARHRLEPESLGHMSIGEHEGWEFDVVDRQIF